MNIKKTYNFQFIVITFLVLFFILFFFTSKLYFPDDREVKVTKTLVLDNHIVQVNEIQQDGKTLEILLTHDVTPKELDLSNVSIYIQKNAEKQVVFEYFKYIQNARSYHYFYIDMVQFTTLEDMYYLTLTTQKETEKVYIDYRNINDVPIIIKNDSRLIEKMELQKKLKILKDTKKEIILSLNNADFDEMQKEALKQQLINIDLSIRGIEEVLLY